MAAETKQKSSLPEAVPGCEIIAHYRLSLEDGSVIDQTDQDMPLQFTLGDGTFPAGVEPMFYGMRAGDNNTLIVCPDQGWGYPDPANIQYLLCSDFPDTEVLSPGNVIEFTLPNKDSLPGTVLAIEQDRVKVDFNPPLAGHNVTVEISILSVNEP